MYHVKCNGELLAVVTYAEDAAVLAGHVGQDCQVETVDGKVLWREGAEATCALDEVEKTVAVIEEREERG